MKGELNKLDNGWMLLIDNVIYATDNDKLSIKNCQAIELFGVQQTEWDVEIEMICPHPMDTYRCGLQYGCDEDGCNHPNQVPYLDTNGCLILKRK